MLYGKLKSCSLFYELEDKEIDYLCEDAIVKEYKDDEVLFKVGDTIQDLGVIIHGKVELFIKGEETAPIKIQNLYKYDYFGEVIFSNEYDHFYSARVFKDTSIVYFKYESFQRLFEKMPKAFCTLLLNLIRHEHDRLRIGLGIIGRAQDESNLSLRLPIYGQTKRKVFSKKKAS